LDRVKSRAGLPHPVPLSLKSITAEHLFLLGGFVILLSGVGADLALVLSGGEGHHVDRLSVMANFVPAGLAFIAWGYGWRHSAAIFQRRGLLLFAAFVATVFDGAVHLFAFNEHLGVPLHAVFFAVVAPAQLLGAFRFLHAGRRELALWALFTAFLVGLYGVTRSFPVLGDLEAVEGLGLLSKAAEIVVIVALVQAARFPAAVTEGPKGEFPAGTA